MTKFNSLAEVRAEKMRLIARKEILEEEIRLDFEELKDSMKPANLIKNAFRNDTSASTADTDNVKLSPMAVSLTGMVIDLLVTRLFMKRSSLVKKFITSYLIRTTGPGIVEKAGPAVVSRISNLVGRFFHHKNGNGVYDQTTASDTY